MLIVALALVVVAATAAVVIRDAHPRLSAPDATRPDEAPEPPAEPDPVDAPTQAVDMSQLTSAEVSDLDAPTQSMPLPVAFAGAQAAALLPYPAAIPEPSVEAAPKPAAFVPAGTPYPQPDPDRLIQTEVVIDDPQRAHNAAMTRLALGIAVSGTAIGLGVMGAARGVAALIHMLLH